MSPAQAVPTTARAAVSRLNRQGSIATLAIVAIIAHLLMRYVMHVSATWRDIPAYQIPLLVALVLGGTPLVIGLAGKVLHRQFSSDLLAGISIVTAVILHEYLAGVLVVLMLSGGEALEAYAVRSASSVLNALARRMPNVAHKKTDEHVQDVPLDQIGVGDLLVVFPHETCPVDGTVVDGHGSMDESYLTGEPYVMSKAPGASVISGAVNGQSALTIRADRLAVDSRYAKIMQVMRESEQRRPSIRRLGDQLGAIYTPVALTIAVLAWIIAGSADRFLSVLVVATPCPLLIAIPVAIIGSVSLAARRGIIVRDPAILEKVSKCRVALFDKTGTLTYGEPTLTGVIVGDGIASDEVLSLTASLERYSRHPLADAVINAAKKQRISLGEAVQVSEKPGEGLRGSVRGKAVQITSRKKYLAQNPGEAARLPDAADGMEAIVLVDGGYAATLRFRDEPREDGSQFIRHLFRRHQMERVMLISGDRESEVRYLADKVGIKDVRANQSPEQKLALVRAETERANTLYLGDGINDAPALTAATVGVAFGQASDITSEAAGAVILDSSLARVDELLHIGRRMRTIALQSAIGGMAVSIIGMLFAAAGYLPPVAGAITQEIIDVLAVVNALRVAIPPKSLTDY